MLQSGLTLFHKHKIGGLFMYIADLKAIFVGAVLIFVLTGCGTQTHPDVEQIADGTFLYRSGDQRSLFLVTDDGVIVTDPINASVAGDYRAAIAAITDQPVKFVVYSHYHWDRVAGAQIFKDEGAQIVAQEKCAQRFIDNPNPAVVFPDITFDDYYEVALGDQSLELHYFGPSHGDCLTVFLVRPANLVQMVDIVNPPRAAFPADPNVPYIKPHNLQPFFESVMAMVAKRGVGQVIASRVTEAPDDDGRLQASPPTAPVSIIDDQAKFWSAIENAVEVAEAEGNIGIDSFVRLKTIDLTPFQSYAGYNEQDLPIIMRRFVGFNDMGR
jgi:glyoxylase-like metal-dependent hydrolase (beta-lactamase superfamily II)